MERRSLISPDNTMSIQRQCDLLSLQRSSYYYTPKESEEDTKCMNEIHDIWIRYPFYGYRRITVILKERGIEANHKRVMRLMKLMGLRSILPKPRLNTSISSKLHQVQPYLLKDINITRPNQVWATDITYIKLPGGMVYLFALIDWHTRFVVGWKLATTMEASHIIEIPHMAVTRYGVPEIINADQGSQFTCEIWISTLRTYGIKISHDGVGRCIDNIRIERLWWSIKYEHIHLFRHQTVWDLENGLTEYLDYYNNQRPHQSLGYKKPADFYLAKVEIQTRNARHMSRGSAPNPVIFIKSLKEI